jgi:hypothetical protein
MQFFFSFYLPTLLPVFIIGTHLASQGAAQWVNKRTR